MKNATKILFSILLLSSISFSQFSEDVLRYSSKGNGVGSRALGMGNAYIGISDDFSATIWNPAGLGQMRRLEFSFGIINNSKQNDFIYLGNSSKSNISSTALDNLSFVFPFPTVQGSLVFAFSYNHNQDFKTLQSVKGFNSTSSIIPSLFSTDIPYYTNLSTLHDFTPIRNNVYQVSDTKESGSSSDWNFSGAIEVEKNLFFGLTLDIYSGSFKSEKYFDEYDSKGIYANIPLYDTVKSKQFPLQDSFYVFLFNTFNQFQYKELLSADVAGAQIDLGLLYQISDELRFGLTVHFPNTITVKESYRDEGSSLLDNTAKYTDGFDATNEYGIKTPWIFGAGSSYYFLTNLLVSADVEYIDWTQVEFTDNKDVEILNWDLQSLFRSVINYRFGMEFWIPATDIRIRGGYSLTPSPYKGDPSSFDQKLYTAGAGIFLQRNIVIDGAIGFGSYKSFRNQYSFPGIPNSSRTDESISTTSVNVTLSYRF